MYNAGSSSLYKLLYMRAITHTKLYVNKHNKEFSIISRQVRSRILFVTTTYTHTHTRTHAHIHTHTDKHTHTRTQT